MDRQLDLAPVGYLVMDESLRIIEMNKMMMEMTTVEAAPAHMHELLTTASRVYFQTYFIPAIITHGAVSEMFLRLKSSNGPVPVLMNTFKRNELLECAFMQMPVRNEYETELLNAKKEAETISQATAEANAQLKSLLSEVESKKDELNLLNERLQELTVTDALTGLKNRRYLEEFLPKRVNGGSTVILMIDIDFFKKVNDTFGHHAGDVVLQNLALLLEEVLANAGYAARLGGEEFVAVLPLIDLEDAGEIAEKIRRRVELHDWLYQPITVSVGVAEVAEGNTLSEMLKQADVALYNSKNTGRNRVTVSSC